MIENAVPAGETHGRHEARAALGLSDDVAVAVCVARLAAPKRHDLLLEAWAALADDEAILLVVGDGPQSERLRDDAARLRLGQRVRFLGTRTDVARLHAASDVAVLASDREGLPMAVLEALAAGVPVVASDVGGLTGLGDAVCRVVPGSAPALAEALSVVLRDPARGAQLARAGRAVVLERFGPETMRAAYLSAYAQVRREAPVWAGADRAR